MSKVIREDIARIASEFERELEDLEGKVVLITGANGMIPSYIADIIAWNNKLLHQPTKLLLYSRNKTTKSSRLGHLLDDKNVRWVSGDIGKPFSIPSRVNLILHGASRASPASFKQEPLDTIDANVNGTRTLLEYAAKNGLEQFLLFSSSEVYGNPPKEQIPTPETYLGNVNCMGDMACYAEAKRFSETLCTAFFRKHNVATKALRIFQTIGPGLRDDGKTIAKIFSGAINEGKIVLRDPGLSQRSYGYVGDTARGILQVMFYGKSGEAYNIGDDTNYCSIKEVAEIVKSILNVTAPIQAPDRYPAGKERIENRSPDILKLRNLGFKPKTNLETSLRRTGVHYLETGI